MCVHPATFLPHIAGLRLDRVAVTDQLITLTLSCVQTTALRPLCQQPSTKVHSFYTRTMADLPWSDRRVCLGVQARRFVCAVKTCARKIFCERLPDQVVVDLLPDRTAETVASWLQEHPGIAVISRDRGQTYTEGATIGAPDAVQVADRWHIAKNLGEALERYLARHQRVLQDVAWAVADALTPGPAAAAVPAPAAPPRLTRRQMPG